MRRVALCSPFRASACPQPAGGSPSSEHRGSKSGCTASAGAGPLLEHGEFLCRLRASDRAGRTSRPCMVCSGPPALARRPSRSCVGLARTRAAHDVFDVAAADADIAQLIVRELRQFAHRLSVPAPSVELLRDHFEGDHIDSFSGAMRLLGRRSVVAGALAATRRGRQSSPQRRASAGPRRPCSRTHRKREQPSLSNHAAFRRSSRR